MPVVFNVNKPSVDNFEVSFSPTTNGQTIFSVTPLPTKPNLALCFVNGVKYNYGEYFTFMTDGTFTWLNTSFQLKTIFEITLIFK